MCLLRRCLSISHFIHRNSETGQCLWNDSRFSFSLKWIFHIFHASFFSRVLTRYPCPYMWNWIISTKSRGVKRRPKGRETNISTRWMKHLNFKASARKAELMWKHQNVFIRKSIGIENRMLVESYWDRKLIRPHERCTLNHFFLSLRFFHTFSAFIRKYLLISCLKAFVRSAKTIWNHFMNSIGAKKSTITISSPDWKLLFKLHWNATIWESFVWNSFKLGSPNSGRLETLCQMMKTVLLCCRFLHISFAIVRQTS